jgi:hypothetical protein
MFKRRTSVQSANGSIELAKEQGESQLVSAEVAADIAEEELLVTDRERDPRLLLRQVDNRATRALAVGRRTIRLLWLALVLSIIGHLIIPICLVSVLQHPEKVALMDGTQSLTSLRNSLYSLRASLLLRPVEYRRPDDRRFP